MKCTFVTLSQCWHPSKFHYLSSQIFQKHPLQSADTLDATCNNTVFTALTGLNESWSSETEFRSELQRILAEQQHSDGEVAEPNTVGDV